jgi:hypothetical protein
VTIHCAVDIKPLDVLKRAGQLVREVRLRLSAALVILAGLGNRVCDAVDFDGAVVGEACMLTGRTASRGLAAVIVLLP